MMNLGNLRDSRRARPEPRSGQAGLPARTQRLRGRTPRRRRIHATAAPLRPTPAPPGTELLRPAKEKETHD